jgi:hypothetical protein
MILLCLIGQVNKFPKKVSSPTAVVNVHQINDNASQVSRRIERKFFVLPWNIDIAGALLRQFCRLDNEYPKEQINSLYFDTEDLNEYERSSSGEFRKDKMRIRWYHWLGDYQDSVPVFLELKTREGFTGSKQRQRLMVPVHSLEPINLYKGIIPFNTIMDTLAGFGYFPETPIHPVVVISYWRYRFNELLTGMRVNLDCNIRSTIVNRTLGFGERELKLVGGVIEVKGSKMELPETLRRMKLLDLDWSRFSKYSSCLDSHLSQPGAMARLWPSGRITLS